MFKPMIQMIKTIQTGDPDITSAKLILDFKLLAGTANLFRHGLKLDTRRNQGKFTITAQCTEACEIEVLVKQTGSEVFNRAMSLRIPAGNSEMVTVSEQVPNADSWSGTIESMQLQFSGSPDATVVVDSIFID